MSKPVRRVTGKTTYKADTSKDDEESRQFWAEFADDLDKHHKSAKKLAEVVRNTVVTTKVAGRVVPNKTTYVRTTTKKSHEPIPGKS